MSVIRVLSPPKRHLATGLLAVAATAFACGSPSSSPATDSVGAAPASDERPTGEDPKCSDYLVSIDVDLAPHDPNEPGPSSPEEAMEVFFRNTPSVKNLPKAGFERTADTRIGETKKFDTVQLVAQQGGSNAAVLEVINMGGGVWGVESALVCQEYIDKYEEPTS